MNRRNFLAASAPIVAAAALAVPALSARADVNPDAAILAAFDDYVAAYRRIDVIAAAGNPEQEAAYAAMYAAEDAIADGYAADRRRYRGGSEGGAAQHHAAS